MTAFAAATDVLFRDPHLAIDAAYRAGGAGSGVSVRVIRSMPDRIASFGEGRFVQDSVQIDVRVSEVAVVARGDTFEIGGDLYEVMSDPVRDSDRLVWSAEARAL